MFGATPQSPVHISASQYYSLPALRKPLRHPFRRALAWLAPGALLVGLISVDAPYPDGPRVTMMRGPWRSRGHLSMPDFVAPACVVLCAALHAPGEAGLARHRSLRVGLVRSPGAGMHGRSVVLFVVGCFVCLTRARAGVASFASCRVVSFARARSRCEEWTRAPRLPREGMLGDGGRLLGYLVAHSARCSRDWPVV